MTRTPKERCNYTPGAHDRRKRCRKAATVTVQTVRGGLVTKVCADHLHIYTENGWVVR